MRKNVKRINESQLKAIVAESVKKVMKEMFMMNQGNGSDVIKVGEDNHAVIWAPLTYESAKRLAKGAMNIFGGNYPDGERYFSYYANSDRAVFIVKSNYDDSHSFFISMDRNGKNIKAYDWEDREIDKNHLMRGAAIYAVKMIKPKVAEVCDALAERQGGNEEGIY